LCARWTEFFTGPEEGEIWQAVGISQAYNIRGRNNYNNTLWFWIISFERKAVNDYLFERIDNQSVSIKFNGKFITTQDKFGKTTGCMDNLWLLNENDGERNKPDPKYKGSGAAATVAGEYNLTPPMIFLVRNCFFILDMDGTLVYIPNRK
jgi:hypothetical protein